MTVRRRRRRRRRRKKMMGDDQRQRGKRKESFQKRSIKIQSPREQTPVDGTFVNTPKTKSERENVS